MLVAITHTLTHSHIHTLTHSHTHTLLHTHTLTQAHTHKQVERIKMLAADLRGRELPGMGNPTVMRVLVRLRVEGSGFGVQGSGFRVQGPGFRVQGSGVRGER